MKQLLLIVLCFLSFSTFSQSYPFTKNFVDGAIILKDSTKKPGQVKWAVNQNQRLSFRENPDSKTEKFSAEEIAGFTADSLKFVSLVNFEAYAENYPLLGMRSRIRNSFGQLIAQGKFDICFVIIVGYDAVSSTVQSYPNFLFRNTQDPASGFVAYPFAIRMRDRRYENAKEKLYELFKDYPAIVEKIRKYRQHENFYEIVEMIKELDRP